VALLCSANFSHALTYCCCAYAVSKGPQGHKQAIWRLAGFAVHSQPMLRMPAGLQPSDPQENLHRLNACVHVHTARGSHL